MDDNINVVFSLLKEYFGRYKENDKELQVRCFYCGDSRSKPNKMSLYISKKPVEPYNTYMFHCFRASCGMSGTLLELLTDTGLINSPKITKDIIKQLTPSSKPIATNKSSIITPSVNTYQKLQQIHKHEDIFNYKLQYVKGRLKLNIIPDYISKTIITNVQPFLKYSRNEISDQLKQYLITNFVCFRTYKFGKLICRNIDNNSSFRYYNIHLNNIRDYYITSPELNNLSLLSNGTLILAEGIFTLLHGYHYLLQNTNLVQLSNNVLLAATGGGGNSLAFYNLLKFMIFNFGVIDWDILVLSDLEIPLEHYKVLKQLTLKNITVLYNKSGDFGDENIKPVKYII